MIEDIIQEIKSLKGIDALIGLIGEQEFQREVFEVYCIKVGGVSKNGYCHRAMSSYKEIKATSLACNERLDAYLNQNGNKK